MNRTHLRYAVDNAPRGELHVFVLDGSASMLGSLAQAKGWLLDSFDRLARARSDVALIRFGGERAEVLFGPAIPRWWNERWIEPIGGGGGTPLAAGIAAASRLLARAERARGRHASQVKVLWLLTDGRTAETPSRPPALDRAVVIDCEPARLGLGVASLVAPRGCERLARAWDAECIRLDEIAPRVQAYFRCQDSLD
ncbi:magnesium chelatase [Pandoraea anhela]|uniref:Magnesium chelatase n=1 Tax=Pandoraea anhela TaxID=2508295 RepID=A0A5E4VZQ2_9BURK|nr:VWA domain-containing protein [Pandoraea anhela]VVE18107.1 magnesium chelatase [Pandoraea anhela]